MSEILADTSVWIDFFQTKDSPFAKYLDHLFEEESVCTTNLIKAEIIPGAKSEKEYHLLYDYFNALPLAREPDDLWGKIINYQFLLKKKGIYGISIPDLIIITVAIYNNKVIFSKDKHFKLAKKVLPFKIIEHLS